MLSCILISNFIPLLNQQSQWSERKQAVAMPLFPGYVFVHIFPSPELQVRVLKIPGVVEFVRNSKGALPIPEREIEAVRMLPASGIAYAPIPFLKAGDWVRVFRGPLAGVEGQWIRFGSQSKLVLSVEAIRRSLTVSVPRGDIEMLTSPAAYPSPSHVSSAEMESSVKSGGR
jgi:transcription termination/antitermination protein NusG